MIEQQWHEGGKRSLASPSTRDGTPKNIKSPGGSTHHEHQGAVQKAQAGDIRWCPGLSSARGDRLVSMEIIGSDTFLACPCACRCQNQASYDLSDKFFIHASPCTLPLAAYLGRIGWFMQIGNFWVGSINHVSSFRGARREAHRRTGAQRNGLHHQGGDVGLGRTRSTRATI